MASVLVLLLAGCGGGVVELGTTTASSTPSPSAHPSSNQRLFARAVRLLEQVGATGVAEADPAHGGPAVSLYGEWRGHEVLVGVVPTEKVAFDEEVLRSYQVRDRAVRVVDSPPYSVHQVNIARDLWSLVVPDGEALTQELAEALVATQLPPEETPAQLVEHADNLYGVRVERAGDELASTSVWGISCDHYGCDPSVLVRGSGDDRTYEVGAWEDLQKALRTDAPQPDNPFGAGRLAQPVVSLRPGVEALIGGGDGATLLPFELVSRNGGAPQRITEPRGTQTAGAVVLADGRLLALLTSEPGRYALWVSDRDDWTRYVPYDVGPARATSLGASAAPDPVVWLQTSDYGVFVSTDDAATFSVLQIR